MRVLAFNSCFFGFYAHFGFARELERAGVEASAFAGSSAGAIVAACLASGLGAERGIDLALGLRRADFWDEDHALGTILRLGRVRGARFEKLLEERLPVARIEACPRPLLIATTVLPLLEARVLSSGPLARTVHASCAVPLLLQPVRLGRELHVDGGVRSEAPVRALVERYRPASLIVHVGSWAREKGARRGGPPPLDPGLARSIQHARARGTRVVVARTVYPRLDPDRLERAGDAVLAGERTARRLLARALPCPTR